MSYTEEEINKYLNILYNYNKPMQQVTPKSKCLNCPNTESFTIDSGYKICDECGTANGHVLGFYDVKDYDRLYYLIEKRVFIIESITMRKRLIKFLKE